MKRQLVEDLNKLIILHRILFYVKIPKDFTDIPISYSEFISLQLINLLEELNVGKLAHIMGISISAMSKILTSLEEKGFIERVNLKEERRKVFLKLTKKGQHFVKKIEESETKQMMGLFEMFEDLDSLSSMRESILHLIRLISSKFELHISGLKED